ncbi:MAG: M48 family metalloprotease [Rubrivivax sp.]|nr:M48 family metalloprotease [Rubrivivax sp.]
MFRALAVLTCLVLPACFATAEPAQGPGRPAGFFPPGGLPFIPVGPQPGAVPVNSEGWRSVVQSFGAPMSGPQTKLVEDIVAELSRAAGSVAPRGGYRATLLDTSVVNAFAIGDGNVFMTRQLLACMNSEDELIGVMGHEVGHVIGGHTPFTGAARAGQAGGDRLLGVFVPALRGAALVASTAVVQTFGRSQEHSADVAGVKFLADLGRDPQAMGRALAVLDAHGKLQQKLYGGGQAPRALDYWLSSHPLHAERVGLVRLAASMAPRAPARTQRSPAAFVRELDGMVIDDGPEHGIVNGTVFRHPTMKLGLDAAPGLRLINSPQALLVRASKGSAATLKSVAGGGTPVERFLAAWVKSLPEQIKPPTPEPLDHNGIQGASGSVLWNTDEGSVQISMWLYAWTENQSFIYVAFDPAGAQAAEHTTTARSFRRLTDAEAAAVKLRRISVVDIQPGDTVASLSERMAYPDFREDRFRLINGLFSGQSLPKSGPIKLVIWSPQ